MSFLKLPVRQAAIDNCKGSDEQGLKAIAFAIVYLGDCISGVPVGRREDKK